MTMRDDLIADLRRDEDERFVVYDDATGKPLRKGDTLQGSPTISVGVNVTVPITKEQSDTLFLHRLDSCLEEATLSWPWFMTAPASVRRGIINMLYNLGMPTLMEFHLMLGALEQGRYSVAATEALNSEWARQVGDRATRIAQLFRSAANGIGGTS